MRWTLLAFTLIGTAFADSPQALSAAEKCKTSKAETAPQWDADLFRRDDQVFSSHIEFLYWKTIEGTLMYGQKMNQPAWDPAGLDNAVEGPYQNSQFNIDPGFRVALSFFRAPHYWEVWAMYTRLTARGNNSASPPAAAGEYLTSAWALPTSMAQLNSINTSLHLNYNVADFMVDRYFNPNHHLRLRMLAGITGTWLDQNWTMLYTDIDQNTSNVQSRWDYWGCGFRLGVQGDWYWTADIYLTLRGTFAGFIGPYHNRTFQTTNILTDGANSTLPVRNGDYRDTRPVTNLQLLLGPSWQKNWPTIRTELFVGYEINTWMNLQEVYHSTLNTSAAFKETWINSSLIALQGLTARFTVDY